MMRYNPPMAEPNFKNRTLFHGDNLPFLPLCPRCQRAVTWELILRRGR